MHTLAPVRAWYEPAPVLMLHLPMPHVPHVAALVAPVALEARPNAHSEHFVTPAPEYLPTPHETQPPLVWYLPAAQSWHVCAPVEPLVMLHSPDGHWLQRLPVASPEYECVLPAGHFEHPPSRLVCANPLP